MTFLKQTIIFLGAILLATITTAQSVDSCPPLAVDISFKYRSIYLSPKAKAKLDSVYTVMKNYPSCKIRVEGYGPPSEGEQQTSWDVVAAVIKYLIAKGISKENFLFVYGEEGNPLKVSISASMEDWGYWVPAPHPCYSLFLPRKKRCVKANGDLNHD